MATQTLSKLMRFTLLATMLASLGACAPSDDAALAAKSRRVFGTLPDAMPGSENDTPAMVRLGHELFTSTELSINRTQSCDSCHRLDAAGVDRLVTSPGASGEAGTRNTPTVLNAGLHTAQFWDGRAKTLEEQASGPILNPVEMAMPSEEEILSRLRESRLRAMFETAFPGDPDPVSMRNLSAALAAFQRTLITRDRFDAFQNGDYGALTSAEKLGLQRFMETGCVSCHGGPLLGGHIFQKMGIVNPYPNADDLGVATVTSQPRDRYVFKVPALRNVSETSPYFHDGGADTLPEAVEQMAWLQLGAELTEADRDAIVAFLGALSGEIEN
jgi:cytochrome c peroxidase